MRYHGRLRSSSRYYNCTALDPRRTICPAPVARSQAMSIATGSACVATRRFRQATRYCSPADVLSQTCWPLYDIQRGSMPSVQMLSLLIGVEMRTSLPDKIPHRPPAFGKDEARSRGRGIVVAVEAVGLDAAAGDRDRHVAVAVRLRAQRRGMVGRDEDPPLADSLARPRTAGPTMCRSICSRASILASARPSCEASSGASTWTHTRSCSFKASTAYRPLAA